MKNENCDKRLFCDDYKYNHCDGCGANKPKGDLISREALLKRVDEEREYLKARGQLGAEHILVYNFRDLIDNAPTIAVNFKDCDGYEAGYSAGLKDAERPQDRWGKWSVSEIQCPNCLEYFQTDCYSKEELNKCPCCGAEMRGGVEHGSNDR